MHLDDLTIFRERIFGSKQEREARQIAPFLFGLTLHMDDLADVSYVTPDPPDFALHMKSGATVGIELTELVRSSAQQRKGDKQYRIEFPEWENQIKSHVGTVEAEFSFSQQSMRDMFGQFSRQLEQKGDGCQQRQGEFSEMWLAFHIPLSNPMGALIAYQRCLEKLGEVFSRLWGRFLYDADHLLREQQVFNALVFFSDSSHFALTRKPTSYGGVPLNGELLTISSRISDDEYDSLTVRATRQIKHSKLVKEDCLQSALGNPSQGVGSPDP